MIYLSMPLKTELCVDYMPVTPDLYYEGHITLSVTDSDTLRRIRVL